MERASKSRQSTPSPNLRDHQRLNDLYEMQFRQHRGRRIRMLFVDPCSVLREQCRSLDCEREPLPAPVPSKRSRVGRGESSYLPTTLLVPSAMEQGVKGSKRLTTSTATSTTPTISTSAISAASTASTAVSSHLGKSGINLLLCLGKNSN
jgi:hypothetical protein